MFRVQGLGLGVQGLGLRVEGQGLREVAPEEGAQVLLILPVHLAQGLGFRAQGVGFGVSGFWFRFPDAWFRARHTLMESFGYRGTSPIRKRPPPYDPTTTLGIGLR